MAKKKENQARSRIPGSQSYAPAPGSGAYDPDAWAAVLAATQAAEQQRASQSALDQYLESIRSGSYSDPMLMGEIASAQKRKSDAGGALNEERDRTTRDFGVAEGILTRGLGRTRESTRDSAAKQGLGWSGELDQRLADVDTQFSDQMGTYTRQRDDNLSDIERRRRYADDEYADAVRRAGDAAASRAYQSYIDTNALPAGATSTSTLDAFRNNMLRRLGVA